MPKINMARVRKIVNEELDRVRVGRLAEFAAGPDHKATATVVSAASKLLAALEAFDKMTKDLPAVKSTTQTNVDGLMKALAHMVEAPTSYAKAPSKKRIVRLRPQKEDGDVL